MECCYMYLYSTLYFALTVGLHKNGQWTYNFIDRSGQWRFGMNDKFFSLPLDKQQRIINAAYKVFSQNNYKKAPMAEIASEGDISKALLFHYFTNKKSCIFTFGTMLSNKFIKQPRNTKLLTQRTSLR